MLRSAPARLALTAQEAEAGHARSWSPAEVPGSARAVAAAFARDRNGVVVTGRRPELLAAGVAAQTANGRGGPQVDVAPTVLFLASPDARHLTGQPYPRQRRGIQVLEAR